MRIFQAPEPALIRIKVQDNTTQQGAWETICGMDCASRLRVDALTVVSPQATGTKNAPIVQIGTVAYTGIVARIGQDTQCSF